MNVLIIWIWRVPFKLKPLILVLPKRQTKTWSQYLCLRQKLLKDSDTKTTYLLIKVVYQTQPYQTQRVRAFPKTYNIVDIPWSTKSSNWDRKLYHRSKILEKIAKYSKVLKKKQQRQIKYNWLVIGRNMSMQHHSWRITILRLHTQIISALMEV